MKWLNHALLCVGQATPETLKALFGLDASLELHRIARDICRVIVMDMPGESISAFVRERAAVETAS